MRCILLNPGPVSLSDSVRKAAVSSDLCHREPEFFKLQDKVRQGILDVYGCHSELWAAVLLGGSGTTALEAMLSSLAPRHAKLLVIENGLYGERISQVAEIHGIDHRAIRHQWGDEVNFDEVEQELSAGLYTHVAVVHHETTTGRLNDIRRLARLCDKHGAELLVDAVSSFGAEDIPFESPALAACAATSHKCLHGIPGLSFVLARREALAEAAEPPRSLYMHLPFWLEKQDRKDTPFTPPVNSMLALRQALKELAKQGSWEGRRERYQKRAVKVRESLNSLGVEALLDAEQTSSALTTYQVPEGMTYGEIHDGLKRWGFVIFAGQGSLALNTFQISTMGDITQYDVERLLAAIETVFKR